MKSKADQGKIVYNTKEGRFGRFLRISDYNEFEEEVVTKEEKRSQDKFYSCKIFCNELVGNLSSRFWTVISNFNCCFLKKEIEAHFDKKIKDLEEELAMWKEFKITTLEDAEKYLEGFDDLKQSTNYFDYKK